MNTIITLQPSFSDWLLDLISGWINMFDEAADDDDEDRGDAHEEDDKDEEDASGNKAKKDDEEDPEKDTKKVAKKASGDKDEDNEDDEPAKTEHMIPKSRYDSAANRAKNAEELNDKLEQENASLRDASQKDPDVPDRDTQLSDLDRKIEEARADNNIDQVVALGKEQRTLEREYNAEVATTTSTAAGKAAREQIQLDAVVDDLEEQYDVLNEDHENFDQTVIGEILDIQQGLVLTGKYSPAQAMRKASKLILPTAVTASETPDPKVTDIKKNLEAAKKMPPDTGEKGENSDKGGDIEDGSAVSEMTMEEFDAIPESTLKRLRGDAI